MQTADLLGNSDIPTGGLVIIPKNATFATNTLVVQLILRCYTVFVTSIAYITEGMAIIILWENTHRHILTIQQTRMPPLSFQ